LLFFFLPPPEERTVSISKFSPSNSFLPLDTVLILRFNNSEINLSPPSPSFKASRPVFHLTYSKIILLMPLFHLVTGQELPVLNSIHHIAAFLFVPV